MENRKGRQTPTVSYILPYEQSKGAEAVEIYNKSGRTAQEWQELLLEDIMAQNPDNLWTHMIFGYSVPRRNGKSELLIPRVIWGFLHGERILYTAHRTTTSHSAWERITDLLSKTGLTEGEDYKTTKQFGLEHIEGLRESDGVVNFRTRSSKGGLGEGYDLLIIDEAQEYTADQETALKYVVTDSRNPQTIMCGTPPTAVSSGTVFQQFRQLTLTGQTEDSGWAEWSVAKMSDTHDVELWYETNPSLGTILTERNIRSELGKDPVDDNIQRLGLWIEYNQKSAISREDWEQYKLQSAPILKEKRLYFGVKYSKSTGNVSLAVAVRTADEQIFVEAIDCRGIRDGNAWLVGYLVNIQQAQVVIDGAGQQRLLEQDLKAASAKIRAILPTVSNIIEANALFEQKLFEGHICHMGQPSLTQAVANCEHRQIGTGGGFGYSSLSGNIDVSLVEAVSLAHWLCANAKEPKKQIITY